MDMRCTRKIDGFPCRSEIGHTQGCEVDFDRHYADLEAARIGSAKITRLLERARNLGLEVEVVVEESPWVGGDTYRSVKAEIRRPRAEATNALEQIQQSESLNIGWAWIVRNGVTPKMYGAWWTDRYSSDKVQARHLTYRI